MKNKSTNLFFLLVLGVFFAAGSGCTMKLVEDHNSEISSVIVKVAKTTDAFLLNMIVSSSVTDGSRSFENYAGGYAAVENELISLRLQNQVRPLNDNAYRITETALEMWLEFAQKHKENDSVSNALIEEMRISMQDAFRAILIADEGEQFIMLQ